MYNKNELRLLYVELALLRGRWLFDGGNGGALDALFHIVQILENILQRLRVA